MFSFITCFLMVGEGHDHVDATYKQKCEGKEASEAHVVPGAADGGRYRTWESGWIQEKGGYRCDRSPFAKAVLQRSLSLTRSNTHTHTLTHSLTLFFPSSFPLSLTHSLCPSVSQPLFPPRSLVSSHLRGVQGEVATQAGWQQLDWANRGRS